jgi:hypothetical protein
VRVKLQHKLQPSEHAAHSVILEDDLGNPLFVALQMDDRIVYATAGESDFHALLQALGADKPLVIKELTPKPIENMLWGE